MAGPTIQLEMHVVSDPVTGEWCTDCALPSVISVIIVLVGRRTLGLVARWRQHCCQDCGRSWQTPT